LNTDAPTNTASEGATKKRRDQSTTNNKKDIQKHKNNNTCEKCDPMKLESAYIQNTQQRKALPQRGRECALTVCHIFHRPRIPFGHVLIERRCVTKHCNRGCNKEQRDQPTTNNKKVPFQNRKNRTCENCDPIKLELSIFKYTTAEGVATERLRKYTYFQPYQSPPPYSIWTRPD